MIYLDNAATTMVAPEVVKAMQSFFTKNYGNASSLHSMGAKAAEALEESRSVLAKKVNAEASEFIFLSGGSEADNLAIKGAVEATGKKKIITSAIEHPAVSQTCKCLAGVKTVFLPVDSDAFIDFDALEREIGKDVAVVSIMHANNEVGTIQDIAKIGKLCRGHGVLFHTDAVQSFCKVPFDVKKANVDLASFSAHKIHGPKGVGALFVRKGVKLARQMDGGGHEHGLRAGTENVAGAVGFAKAVELSNSAANAKMAKMRDALIKSCLEIDDSFLNGPKGVKRLCNNANIRFHYVEGEALLTLLDADGIEVSTGSACSSKSLAPSHVLTAMGIKKEFSHGSIRFTFSRFNKEREVGVVASAVGRHVKNLRELSAFRKGVALNISKEHSHED